jgi:Protein of unknown function (DUF3768)
MLTTPQELKAIRELNDHFRRTFRGGQIFLTQGVAELPDMVKASALMRIADFTAFTDKSGEHSFGVFYECSRRIWFKIYYFGQTMKDYSTDPANPEVTKRVMIVGLTHEL